MGARIGLALAAALLLKAGGASAQSVSDGSDSGIGRDRAQAIFALIGKAVRDPSTAIYGKLRRGRSGAWCGEVDATNRMGAHIGPRPFVADVTSGSGGILPDAPELRHPSSMAQFEAMQRTVGLFRENCTRD